MAVDPTNPLSVTRVVVRPPNWLGDAVLALPAIAAVRRHFASAHFTITAVPTVAAIFREDTDARARPRDRAAVRHAGGHRAALEGEGFDLGICSELVPIGVAVLARAHCARWGYGRAGARQLRGGRSRDAATA